MFACGSPQIDLKSNMPHINFQDTYNTGFVFRFESHKKKLLKAHSRGQTYEHRLEAICLQSKPYMKDVSWVT